MRFALFLLLLATAGSAAAQAQSVTSEDLLTFRGGPLPDDSPLGIHAGAFLLTPSIEVNTAWDDNIFHAPEDTVSDLITEIKPALGIQSNWNRHSLFLGAEGEFGFYRENSDLNYNDYRLVASGQYDIAHETFLTATLTRLERHEDRRSLADAGSGDPVDYTVDRGQLEFTRALGRVKLKLQSLREKVSFTNISPAAGDSFDRDNKKIAGKISYDYMPGNGFFLNPSWADTDYDLSSGITASSSGGDLRAGWTFSHPRGLDITLFGGYLFRDYETGSDDTGESYFGGTLDWDITRLTTLSLLLDKNVNDTTIVNAAGVIQTMHRIKLAHDFSYRLTGDVMLGYDDKEYVGSRNAVSDRSTRLYYGDIGTGYEISDHAGLRFKYRYEQHESPFPADEYKDNRAFLSFIYRR